MMTKQTPARMARLVASWGASGKSQASLARRHRIPAERSIRCAVPRRDNLRHQYRRSTRVSVLRSKN
jgi:hypothetical protein